MKPRSALTRWLIRSALIGLGALTLIAAGSARLYSV